MTIAKTYDAFEESYDRTIREMSALHQSGWVFNSLEGCTIEEIRERGEWLRETFGERYGIANDNTGTWICGGIKNPAGLLSHWVVGFAEEKDLTYFLLRWGHE